MICTLGLNAQIEESVIEKLVNVNAFLVTKDTPARDLHALIVVMGEASVFL